MLMVCTCTYMEVDQSLPALVCTLVESTADNYCMLIILCVIIECEINSCSDVQ